MDYFVLQNGVGVHGRFFDCVDLLRFFALEI